MKPNKYSSYNINELPEGCKKCVLGEKLVLFISGKCSRTCWYCSLSNKRRNSEKIWANEREIHTKEELIEEAEESQATSCGITGGDPLCFLERTIEFASALKNHFGEKFHIHIYLPTKLVSLHNLTQLEEYIDEARFHPEFLINPCKIEEDISKVKMAERVFGRQNIGIEIPMIPDKRKEIKDFIEKVKEYVSFINLNEFEASETNQENLGKYELNENGYTIKGSLEEGERLLNELAREHTKLKIHLCSAELKNWHQYKNRLLRHKILPKGKRQDEGTVIYLAIYAVDDADFNKLKRDFNNNKDAYVDENKKRIILSEKIARELKGKMKIYRVEEYPSYDRDEVDKEEL